MENKIKFDISWQVWVEDTKGEKHFLTSFAHKNHAENFWTCKNPHNIKVRNKIFDCFSQRGIEMKKIFVVENFHS
jgi:hypothetical protein